LSGCGLHMHAGVVPPIRGADVREWRALLDLVVLGAPPS
jgi:hypothetical protein